VPVPLFVVDAAPRQPVPAPELRPLFIPGEVPTPLLLFIPFVLPVPIPVVPVPMPVVLPGLAVPGEVMLPGDDDVPGDVAPVDELPAAAPPPAEPPPAPPAPAANAAVPDMARVVANMIVASFMCWFPSFVDEGIKSAGACRS
jgi:hypothetical protein